MPEQHTEESMERPEERQSRLRRFGEFMLRPRIFWPATGLTAFAAASIPQFLRPEKLTHAHIGVAVTGATLETVCAFVGGVLRERGVFDHQLDVPALQDGLHQPPSSDRIAAV